MSIYLKNRLPTTSWRVYILPLRLLRLHEETCREYVMELYDQIIRDGVLKKPLLVEDRYYIVLDGHHRYAVLKMINAKLAPVFLVDYYSPIVEVYSWRNEWNVTKDMVVNAGLTGHKLPYKTSRHILKDVTIPEINIPLEELMEEPL